MNRVSGFYDNLAGIASNDTRVKTYGVIPSVNENKDSNTNSSEEEVSGFYNNIPSSSQSMPGSEDTSSILYNNIPAVQDELENELRAHYNNLPQNYGSIPTGNKNYGQLPEFKNLVITPENKDITVVHSTSTESYSEHPAFTQSENKSYGQLPENVKQNLTQKDYESSLQYQNFALQDHIQGRFPEALKNINEAIKLNPKFSQLYFNRGVARISCGKLSEAILDFDKVINFNKQYVPAYYNRAYTKYMLKNTKEAIEDLTTAISLDSKHRYAYYLLGKIHLQNKSLEIAFKNLEAAKKLSQKDPYLAKKCEYFLSEVTAKILLYKQNPSVTDLTHALQSSNLLYEELKVEHKKLLEEHSRLLEKYNKLKINKSKWKNKANRLTKEQEVNKKKLEKISKQVNY